MLIVMDFARTFYLFHLDWSRTSIQTGSDQRSPGSAAITTRHKVQRKHKKIMASRKKTLKRKIISKITVLQSQSGAEVFIFARAGADLKFDLEPEPMFWVGSGFFF